MARIEFGAVKVGDVARAHMADCLGSNWISYGPKCMLFEQGWGELFGYPYNLAVSSGTDACLNALLSLYVTRGAKQGDEVIVPALSFIATANAVRAAGFKPVFVDIKQETLNIDEDLIEKALSHRTVAIMPVHTMGRPCAMDRIVDIAASKSLEVIEDCCEAHGAKYRGQYVGTFGYAAAFSFYIAHLICCGEGGMVSTMRREVFDAVKSTRSHGRYSGDLYFDFPNFGLNSKMNDMEASIGLEGIDLFEKTFQRRHDIMTTLNNAILSSPYAAMVHTSREDDGNRNCPHGFSITFKDGHYSRQFKNILTRNGIHWKRNFGCTPTQHRAFSYLGHKPGDFPNAEHVGDHGVHFGTHQHLSDDDVAFVIDVITDYLRFINHGTI